MIFILAATTPVTIDVTIVLQTVTALLLAAGLKWVLNLKTLVEVMQTKMEEINKDVDKTVRHLDTAHVHPSQFESLRTVVDTMSEKMTLIWYEFDKATKSKNKEVNNK